ncbi:CBM96 family carbohydrate-binding protein [Paenibacillus chungangensis]|uniref:FIMAH domain-containing protein n=1 Tax=Paenibacillus chungangensis TaxID=696535 RepID=A0ABW3HSP7_9BACL
MKKMKRHFTLFTVFVMVITSLSFGTSVVAQEAEKGFADVVQTDRWAVLSGTAQTPLIDGVLDDEMWSNAVQLSDFVQVYSAEAAAYTTEVRLAYDANNFYIGVNALPPEGEDEAQELFEQMELILSPNATAESFYQISIPISNRATETEAGLKYEVFWDKQHREPRRASILPGDYSLATIQADGSWSAELAIPFSTLGVQQIEPGEEWRFNAIRFREGASPVSTWAPVRTTSFRDSDSDANRETMRAYNLNFYASYEGRMGSLFFAQPSIEDIWGVSSSDMISPWYPEDIGLGYKSFREKELVFTLEQLTVTADQLALSWRDPQGQMSQVDHVQVDTIGDRVHVTFEHPVPREEGTYQLFMLLSSDQEPRYAVVSFDQRGMISAGNERYSNELVIEKTQIEYEPASQQVQDLLAIIPDRMGFRFSGIPHDGEERTDGVYKWSPSNPFQLVTVKDQVVYPNDEYPEDKIMTVTNKRGEEVEYPYYEDEQGRRYFVSGHLWFQQREYALIATRNLAKNDPLGAARVLYRWAELYPGYVPVNDFIWRNYPIDVENAPPNPFWGGILTRWHFNELYNLGHLVEAFHEVRKTNAFELLSNEVGEDVEEKLIEDVFRPEIEFVQSYPIVNSNMDKQLWKGYITLARVLNEPDFIHKIAALMETFFTNQFLSDGFWKEITQDYHKQSINGLVEGIEMINGWSDPEGYVSPRSGTRFDNLDMGELFPALGKSQVLSRMLTYPDGKFMPIQDTWAFSKESNPLLNTGSFLLPASGISKLTRGQGDAQAQLYMNFVPKYGHNHWDPLNLGLYAEGQELLPDIGYSYTRYRRLFNTTFAHNTVLVDSKDMNTSGEAIHGGNISVFAPINEEVQVVRANQESAYLQTSQYEREPWFIGFEGAANNEGYILDIFRVAGGDRHEYTLNGDANRDAAFETDIPLTEYGPYFYPEGTNVIEPATEYDTGSADGQYYGYMYLENVKKGDVDNGQYELTLHTEEDGQEKAKLKITGFVEDGQNELFVGESPSIRATRLNGRSEDLNHRLKEFYMPKYVLRRDGNDLRSTFVTLLEPYSGEEANIDNIELIDRGELREGDVAVAVTYGNTTDYILSSNHPNELLEAGDLKMRGKMGFVRVVDGEVRDMHLVGGDLLQSGADTLEGEGTLEGNVSGTMRRADGDAYNGFVTNSQVSETMAGKYIVVTHPDQSTRGYRIDEIIQDGAHSIISIADHDPGFIFHGDGSSEMMFYPAKKWTGTHTFYIDDITGSNKEVLQSVDIDAEETNLIVGDRLVYTLQGTLSSGEIVDLSSAFKQLRSSNPEVISVNERGEVFAVSAGTAVIEVDVFLNGVKKTAELQVSVREIPWIDYNFNDLNMTDQSTTTRFFAASNTVQFEASEEGHSITFEFEVPRTAEFELGLKSFKAASYGIYTIKINGEPLMDYDFYSPVSGANTTFESLGTILLEQGMNQISFENIGKHEESTNYKMGIIQLRLSDSEDPEIVKLEELQEQLEAYIASGDVGGPLVNQLTNRMAQVQHHYSAGRIAQAYKHLEDFLKHMNNPPMQQNIEADAKQTLEQMVRELLAQYVTVEPTDDASVRGGIHADNNYGSANQIRIYEGPNANTRRKGYVQFQLPALEDVDRATLRLYGGTNGDHATLNIHVLSDHAWSESGITWNTAPMSGTLVGTLQFTGTEQFWDLDVSPYVQSGMSDGVFSFMLDTEDEGVFIDLHSKENINGPQLILRHYDY